MNCHRTSPGTWHSDAQAPAALRRRPPSAAEIVHGQFGISAYGVQVGIQLDDPTLVEPITQCLPPGWKPYPFAMVKRVYTIRTASEPGSPRVSKGEPPLSASSRYLLSVAPASGEGLIGGRQSPSTAEAKNRKLLLELLESDLHLFVAARARNLFVHAGVVVWHGSAIVIPGHSYSGKTTLVQAFMRRGAHYYSDEYAVFTGSGRVRPFARPLSIRIEGKPHRLRVPAPASHKPGGPITVKLLLFTEFRPGTAWDPSAITPGETILSLISNTVPARRRPKRTLSILARVVAGSAAIAAVRGEAAEVVDSVLSWIEAGVPAQPTGGAL